MIQVTAFWHGVKQASMGSKAADLIKLRALGSREMGLVHSNPGHRILALGQAGKYEVKQASTSP